MCEGLEQLEQDIFELSHEKVSAGTAKGIGCDLVSVQRIQDLYVKHKDRFPCRILSQKEMQVWQGKQARSAHASHLIGYLAKRWAGKEAVVKAVGLGFIKNISWREISILNDEQGKPYVQLEGKTAEFLLSEYQKAYGQDKTSFQCLLSLSDEKEHALACCLVV